MKRLIVIAMLGFAAMSAVPAKAQVSLSINIGAQPDWGPRGYNHVDYYYLPDVQSYYYVPTRQFIYFSGNRWIHARSLPSRYGRYDLYGGRKIVINGDRPYLRHNEYRTRYVSNYVVNRPQRVVYRNYNRNVYVNRNVYARDRGNWNRGGDRHDRWDRHDNGNHNGWGNGRGNGNGNGRGHGHGH